MTTTLSMMRAKAERVGKVGMLASEGMEMPVRVLDVKEAWGNMRFLVEPVGGKGQKWVDAVRVGPAAPAPKVDREAVRAELEAATGEKYSDETVELHLECAGEGGVARVVPVRVGPAAPGDAGTRTRLVRLARFIQSHGFGTEIREDSVWLWIPWSKADGEEGEERFEVRTLEEAREVLGY